jgi:hypothetical protein
MGGTHREADRIDRCVPPARRHPSLTRGGDGASTRFASCLHVITADEAFRRLATSAFRRKFRLEGRELAYLQTWGLPHVMKQARDLLRERVAPAEPRNDGRQTPWRNHPVFVAQHATATCCRGCLEKVHEIAKGHALTAEELAYVLAVIERWLGRAVG